MQCKAVLQDTEDQQGVDGALVAGVETGCGGDDCRRHRVGVGGSRRDVCLPVTNPFSQLLVGMLKKEGLLIRRWGIRSSNAAERSVANGTARRWATDLRHPIHPALRIQ